MKKEEIEEITSNLSELGATYKGFFSGADQWKLSDGSVLQVFPSLEVFNRHAGELAEHELKKGLNLPKNYDGHISLVRKTVLYVTNDTGQAIKYCLNKKEKELRR